MLAEHFTLDELKCKHCGKYVVNTEFANRLEALRKVYDKPMIISSWYRCPEHNANVSSTGKTGPHTTGRAVDVLVSGSDCLKLIEIALGLGFTGFGISQKGSTRFLHLDDLENGAGQPRPWIWSY